MGVAVTAAVVVVITTGVPVDVDAVEMISLKSI
jgi:hypothetical protein